MLQTEWLHAALSVIMVLSSWPPIAIPHLLPTINCYSYWAELLDLSRLPYDVPYREAKLLPEASFPDFLGGKMSH